jgi:Asp-tRNA(Asn)/Glu-tRNA(Gln) amidotransferase A subunit family amidase
MPIGMQIISGAFNEAKLFAISNLITSQLQQQV